MSFDVTWERERGRERERENRARDERQERGQSLHNGLALHYVQPLHPAPSAQRSSPALALKEVRRAVLQHDRHRLHGDGAAAAAAYGVALPSEALHMAQMLRPPLLRLAMLPQLPAGV